MMPTNSLAAAARPVNAIDSLKARLGRVNADPGQFGGITALAQGDGTPFLTNRPGAVDSLPDEVVNQAVTGGEMNVGGTSVSDPRALLRSLIEGNANVGNAEALNREFDPLVARAGAENRVRSVGRDFDRTQRRADANSEASTYFDRPVQAMNDAKNNATIEARYAGTAGDRARAEADIYTADREAETADFAAEEQLNQGSLSSLIKLIDILRSTAGTDPAAADLAAKPFMGQVQRLLGGVGGTQ